MNDLPLIQVTDKVIRENRDIAHWLRFWRGHYVIIPPGGEAGSHVERNCPTCIAEAG